MAQTLTRSRRTRRRHGPPAPLRADRFYPVALANALVGSDVKALYPAGTFKPYADITGQFNSAAQLVLRDRWQDPVGKVDFATVVMHELGHGLGVSGWLRKSGTRGGYYDAYPGVFDNFSEAQSGKRVLSFTGNSLMTPSTSVGEATHTPGPIVLGMLRDMGWELGPAGQALVRRLTLLLANLSDPTVAAGSAVTVRGLEPDPDRQRQLIRHLTGAFTGVAASDPPPRDAVAAGPPSPRRCCAPPPSG